MLSNLDDKIMMNFCVSGQLSSIRSSDSIPSAGDTYSKHSAIIIVSEHSFIKVRERERGKGREGGREREYLRPIYDYSRVQFLAKIRQMANFAKFSTRKQKCP